LLRPQEGRQGEVDELRRKLRKLADAIDGDVVVQDLPDAAGDRLGSDRRRVLGQLIATSQIGREGAQRLVAYVERLRARGERVHDAEVGMCGLGGEIVDQRRQ